MKPRGKPFEKGHKSKGGRPLGAKNFTSIDIRQKMFEAVCLVAKGRFRKRRFSRL
jgi:hypothetical protein